jgi:hypothetical protein
MYNQAAENIWVIGRAYDDTQSASIVSLEMKGSSTDLLVHRLVYASNTEMMNILNIDEVLTYDAWHDIKVRCKIDGVDSGKVDLWIDGVSKATANGFSNDNFKAESIAVGCIQNTNSTSDGEYFYIDDVLVTGL